MAQESGFLGGATITFNSGQKETHDGWQFGDLSAHGSQINNQSKYPLQGMSHSERFDRSQINYMQPNRYHAEILQRLERSIPTDDFGQV